MERYFLFQKLLGLLENHSEITDAKMKNYCKEIEVTSEDDEHVIKINVSISDKEENKND